jgi:electron transfer flavoprotein beta subunit
MRDWEVNMEILVCVKRVPDTSENEIELNEAGNDVESDDLVYSINEPDNYAVEEALQIVSRAGGTVSVATVGTEEDEEVLRRQMAMGAMASCSPTLNSTVRTDGAGPPSLKRACRRAITTWS